MTEAFVRKVVRPIRLMAAKFALGNTGKHGCIHTAASFVTYNQIEGDYLEFGVFQGESFAAAYHDLKERRREHLSSRDASPEFKAWMDHPPRFFAFDSFAGL